MFKWEGRRNVQNMTLGIKCWENQCEGTDGGGRDGKSSAEMTLARGLSAGVGHAKPGGLPGQ